MGRNGNDLKLEGMKFGKLTVLRKHTERDNLNRILWVCICDCNLNKEVLVPGHYLTASKKDNCGCETYNKQLESHRKYNTYDLTGEYGIGFTLKGEEFYFDLEDYDKIKDYCWNLHDEYIEANSLNKGTKNLKMHRFIMGVTDFNTKVDHIHHKKHDNRKSELRVCSNAENCANHVIHSNNTSGKSGISYRKDSNNWRVRLWKNFKCYNIGSFIDYEEAVIARDKAEIKYFEEYRYKEGEICNG